MGDDGQPKHLWIPGGLVIPTGNPVQRVNIRLPQPLPNGARYAMLSGSSKAPMVIDRGNQVVMIVESELDAVLLSQEAGDLIDLVALRSSTTRPDAETFSFLQGKKILISLDSDQAGMKEAWGFWLEHFPKAKRWPVIEGKDPTEALQNGLHLRAWVEVGLEEEPEPECKAEPGSPTKYEPPVSTDPSRQEKASRTPEKICRTCQSWHPRFDGADEGICKNLAARQARFQDSTNLCAAWKGGEPPSCEEDTIASPPPKPCVLDLNTAKPQRGEGRADR